MEGAAPEVIENDIVEPLEESLIQIEGIKTISSSCRMGSANITLEFELIAEHRFRHPGCPGQGFPSDPEPPPGHQSADDLEVEPRG